MASTTTTVASQSITSMADVISQCILVNPYVKSVGGTTKLLAADLGLKDNEVPPADLANLGSFQAIPKAALTPFQTARSAMVAACLEHGTRRCGAFLVPLSHAQALKDRLDQIVADVYAAKAAFIATRSKVVDDWLDQPEHRKFADRIRSRLRPQGYFENRIQAGYQMLRLAPPAADGSDIAIDHTVQELTSYDSILSEVAQMAVDVWRDSLHDKPLSNDPDEPLVRKTEVTQRIVSPLRRMQTKLSDLGFVNPVVARAANWLTARLSVLPTTGKMDGRDLEHIYDTVKLLLEPDDLIAAVESSFQAVNAVVAQASLGLDVAASAADPVVAESPANAVDSAASQDVTSSTPVEEPVPAEPQLTSPVIDAFAPVVIATPAPTQASVAVVIAPDAASVAFDLDVVEDFL